MIEKLFHNFAGNGVEFVSIALLDGKLLTGFNAKYVRVLKL